MKCFRHQEQDAVGICRSCFKGVCSNCAADLAIGLACRNACESTLVSRQPEHKDYVRDQVLFVLLGFIALCGAITSIHQMVFCLAMALTSVVSLGLAFRNYKNKNAIKAAPSLSAINADHLENTFSELEKRRRD